MKVLAWTIWVVGLAFAGFVILAVFVMPGEYSDEPAGYCGDYGACLPEQDPYDVPDYLIIPTD